MTNDEFSEFSTKLFVAFPALREWLRNNSPDPQETLRVWRKCLAAYSATECQKVLERWSMGLLEAPKAYEREQIHLMIRSVVEADRTRAAKKLAKQENRDYWTGEAERRRGPAVAAGGDSLSLVQRFSGDMVAAFLQLRPEHQRMLDGELPEADYVKLKHDVLARL